TKSREQVKTIIREGGGRMPAFPGISKNKVENILAFLFENKKQKQGNDGVHSSARSRSVSGESRYINMPAYSRFEAFDGLPAITPPWGTLNAINLHTGKIEWRIPLGNYPGVSGKHPTGMESWGGA